MSNYIPLINELYDEFKNNKIYKRIKAAQKLLFISVSVCMFANFINLFIYSEVVKKIIFISAASLVFYTVYYIKSTVNNKKSKIIRENMIGRFNYLLKQPKYKVFNNITMLGELENYFTLQYSTMEHKTFYSFICKLLEIMCSLFVGYLLSFLTNGSSSDFSLLVLSLFIIVSVTLLFTYQILFELFNFDNKDFLYIFISIIKEKKLKIIASQNNSITNKIKYVLKLGIYS